MHFLGVGDATLAYCNVEGYSIRHPSSSRCSGLADIRHGFAVSGFLPIRTPKIRNPLGKDFFQRITSLLIKYNGAACRVCIGCICTVCLFVMSINYHYCCTFPCSIRHTPAQHAYRRVMGRLRCAVYMYTNR